MNRPLPEPSARLAIWECLLAIMLPLLLLIGNLIWHLGHPVPALTGHNHPLNIIAQLQDFDADPLGHLATFPHGYLPPHFSLYNLAARLTAMVLGKNHLGLVFVSTLYWLVLGAAIFMLTARLAGRRAGLTAMVFVLLMPASLGWSRAIAPSIAVAAWPAVGIWLLVQSRGLARPLPALGFAALAALTPVVGESAGDAAQMLMVFAVAGGYVLLLPPVNESQSRRRTVLVVAGMALVFVALLNTIRLERVLDYLRTEGVDLSGTKYAAGNIFQEPAALLSYPALLWGHHLGPAYCLLAVAALVSALWRPDRKNGLPLVWFLAPLVISTLMPKKDYSYLLAALPALAVLVGLGAARLTKPTHARLALAIVLVLGLVNYARSFTRPSPPPETWSRLITEHVYVGGEYLRLPAWGDGAGAVALAQNAAAATPADGCLLFLARLDSFDAATLRYYFLLARWHDDLCLSDPLLVAENKTADALLEDITVNPGGVVAALVLADERGLLHERNFTSAAEFREYFSRRNIISIEYPEPEDRERLIETTTQALGAIDWEAFTRREWLGRGVSSDNRLRVDVYDRPDQGVEIVLPNTARPLGFPAP